MHVNRPGKDVILKTLIVARWLWEERASLCAFHALLDLRLFGFVYFLFLLVSGIGCGL